MNVLFLANSACVDLALAWRDNAFIQMTENLTRVEYFELLGVHSLAKRWRDGTPQYGIPSNNWTLWSGAGGRCRCVN